VPSERTSALLVLQIASWHTQDAILSIILLWLNLRRFTIAASTRVCGHGRKLRGARTDESLEFGVRNASANCPRLHLAPVEFQQNLQHQKTNWIPYTIVLRCFRDLSFSHCGRIVTNGRTDKRSICRARIASPGRNEIPSPQLNCIHKVEMVDVTAITVYKLR